MAKSEWDQFPVASPLDLALHAEKVSPQVAGIARSIYAQESSSGKNTRTSNAGAVGGMQVIPDTFRRVADKGWDINDPVHNARAGVRYISKLNERAGGDAALTAAGYYGGEGAQDKARRGIAVSDPRNPQAPNTLQYAQQVVGRISVSTQTPKAAADWSQFPVATAEEIAEYEKRQAGPAKDGGSAQQPAKAEMPEKKKPRSTAEELLRQVGLTARHGIAGLASLPAMASDAVTGVLNSGADLVAGKGNGPRFIPAGTALQRTLTAAGLPVPENAVERVVGDATSAMAGAGGFVKGAQALSKSAGPVAASVGKTLAQGPGVQIAGSAAGSGASGATREAGGGTGAQVAAGLAGSLIPSGALTTAKEGLVRGALRGGEAGRQRVAENLETFKQAGTTPTLGQATESRVLRAAESLLGKYPGGAGVIAQRAQRQADEMAAAVQKLSDELAPGASAINAGEAITRGVKAFKANVKQTQARLYDALDTHIPAESRIPSAKTQDALKDLNADIAGAPELSKWFKNARIQGIEGGLKSDTSSATAILSRPGMRQAADGFKQQLTDANAKALAINAERKALGLNVFEPTKTAAQIDEEVTQFLAKQVDGNLPYEALKKLRTLVGKELADNSLVSDVPRSKWSALYAAISDDLGEAAAAAGPKAKAAWDRANKYTRLSLERMDQLSSVVNKDAPEKIFNAAISGTSEGATVVRRLVGALPVQERRELAAAVIQRMGRATPGQQNAVGDAFSTESFLTNLSKLSPSARIAIFGKASRADLEKRVADFAKLAESRRDGGRVFANPSGTAAGAAQLATAASIGGALVSGSPLKIASVVAVPLAARGAAKFMTNPKNAEKLAQSVPVKESLPGAAVGAAARAMQTPVEPEADWSQFPEASPEEIAEYERTQAGAAQQAAPQAAPLQPLPEGLQAQQPPATGAEPIEGRPEEVLEEAPEEPAMQLPGMGASVPADVMNPSGQPFRTRFAAQRAAQQTPGDVVAVDGGFVVRPAPVELVAAGAQPGAAPVAAPAQTSAAPDVLNSLGQPFKTRMAAQLAARQSPGDVVAVDGGFVVRPAPATPMEPMADASMDGGEPEALPVAQEAAPEMLAGLDGGAMAPTEEVAQAGAQQAPGVAQGMAQAEPVAQEGAQEVAAAEQPMLDAAGAVESPPDALQMAGPAVAAGSPEEGGQAPAEALAQAAEPGAPVAMDAEQQLAALEAEGNAEFEQRTAIDTTQSQAMREQAQLARETQTVASSGPLSRAGNVGVEAGAASLEAQADATEKAQHRAVAADILNPAGAPFRTFVAARRAAQMYGGAVVPVEGGFVVRQA